VETVIQRDIISVGDLRRVPLLGRLLRLVAANTAQEINIADWSQRLGADRGTVEGYLGWLRTVFFVHELPSWRRNRASRPVRRPKIHITDSGLTASLLGVDARALRSPTATATGALLETFAVGEFARLAELSDMTLQLHHYRDNSRREVDLVIERADGAVVAVEIKATATPKAADIRHLTSLRDAVDRTEPGAFRAGLLLHTASSGVSLGDRLYTAPIDVLWRY